MHVLIVESGIAGLTVAYWLREYGVFCSTLHLNQEDTRNIQDARTKIVLYVTGQC